MPPTNTPQTARNAKTEAPAIAFKYMADGTARNPPQIVTSRNWFMSSRLSSQLDLLILLRY
jgi:hypothetical protein